MSVDVEGNQRIPTEQVLSELRDVGVSFGKRVSGLNADTIRNQMIINNDEIAWLGVNVRGSRVYVEITERIDTESVPHLTEEKCNLVASKDGVIEKLEVGQGQTMVKKGDGVREGDVLVSGIMDSAYGGFRLVHSYGEVYARTEYTATKEYQLNYIEKEYSGEEKVRFGLNLFGNKIELYPPSMRRTIIMMNRRKNMCIAEAGLGIMLSSEVLLKNFLNIKRWKSKELYRRRLRRAERK